MTDAAVTPKKSAFSFSKVFWVINGIELLERGAFYSTSAVLTVYMTGQLGLSAAQTGQVLALLFLLLYAVPLFAAALAEKYGYKGSLFVAFGLLVAGYGAYAFSNSFALIVLAVTLVGFGAGTFKPLAAALVAQTTQPEERNLAYMIYYGAINIGAFLFPVSIGLVGIAFPEQLPFIAFGLAAALCAINLILVLVLFKNLREPQRDKNVFQALKDLRFVFKDPKFLVLLVIYSGFWFMYAMSLTFITQYMTDFNRMPLWFNVALQQAINPLVIIIGAPLIGMFTKKIHSLALMAIGIGIYVVGFVTVGFSASWILFIAGIVLFSLGEVLTQPSFLSYVSKIAPADRVSIYMGYGFIPIAVGLTFGVSIGGALYGAFAQEAGRPQMFWAIMSAVGLVTIAALLIYNRTMVPPAKEVAPGPASAPRKRGVVGLALAVIAILLVPALVGAASLAPATKLGGDAGTDELLASSDLGTLALADATGTTKAKETTEQTVTLPSNATGLATFTLKWKDEAAGGPGQSNAPDKLRLHVTLPNGTMLMSETIANPQGGEGTIELKAPATAGAYTIGVEVVETGGTTTSLGPVTLPSVLPVGSTPDAGNAWTLASVTQVA